MENKASKNTQQKKGLSWGTVGLGCVWPAVMVALVVAMYKQNQDNQGTYIVSDKENYKIIYAPISDRTDLHVMEFGPFDTDSLWYKYINVGDTIVGNKDMLGRPVIDAATTAYGKSIDFRSYNFNSVNGQRTPDIQKRAAKDIEIARRDSMLREMKTKQR